MMLHKNEIQYLQEINPQGNVHGYIGHVGLGSGCNSSLCLKTTKYAKKI